MKNILFLITIISATLSSCSNDYIQGIRGNKKVVEEERTISSDFNKIKVSQGITLIISKDKVSTLTVIADENIQEHLKTDVKDDLLQIYFDKPVWKAKAKKVLLTHDYLEGIVASSGSRVLSNDGFKSTNMDIKASSGASVHFVVNTEDCKLRTSSGASIEAHGQSQALHVKSSSGSSCKARGLKSHFVSARASSGAHIDTYVKNKLEAKASSGGSITYVGSPKYINKDTSSGGSVSR